MRGETHPSHGLFLEITGGFDGKDGADIMDPLEPTLDTHTTHRRPKIRQRFTKTQVSSWKQSRRTHLTELLWGCTHLPEIGEAGVNNWVFQNGDFSRQHFRRLQAEAVSRGGCMGQGGHRDGRIPIRLK